MKKKYYFAILMFFIFQGYAIAAFEGENRFLPFPLTNSYLFLSRDYLRTKKIVFTTDASQLYSMNECNTINSHLLTFFDFATFGGDIYFFGSGLYNETELGFSLIKGTENQLGFRLKVMKIGTRGYNSKFYGSSDFMFGYYSELINLNSVYSNALSIGYKYSEEKPVSSFSSLLRIYPSTWNSLNIKIIFSELTGTNFEIGNGVKLSEDLSIGGGFDITTKSINSSILLALSQFDFIYSISLHPELGLTHRLGCVFSTEVKTKVK
jgi:hypothetical protein